MTAVITTLGRSRSAGQDGLLTNPVVVGDDLGDTWRGMGPRIVETLVDSFSDVEMQRIRPVTSRKKSS